MRPLAAVYANWKIEIKLEPGVNLQRMFPYEGIELYGRKPLSVATFVLRWPLVISGHLLIFTIGKQLERTNFNGFER